MNPADEITLIPTDEPIRGRVTLPGSKSITNRALLLAALADGRSSLCGALKSVDTTLMATALRHMGVVVDEPDPTSFVVIGKGNLTAAPAPLMLGNAGTAMRFLTAAAATVDGKVVLDGDEHMQKRPIGPLTAALRSLGIDCTDKDGCPPVTVRGQGRFGTGRVEIDGGLSSQYISAILMAAPLAASSIEVALSGTKIGARGYVDLTLQVMRAFGATVETIDERTWRVHPTGYRPTDFAIEPDASAATYLWALEAVTTGAIDIHWQPDDFTQPDARAYDLIRRYPDMPPTIDGSQIQDAVPTLAVLSMFNRTPVRFTGIANLRVKECDRVAALATELSRIRSGLGTEDGDDLIVHSDPALAGQTRPTRIETYADHRIAMSFALAGLKIGGITIKDPACVAKTYPGYWDTLRALGVRTT